MSIYIIMYFNKIKNKNNNKYKCHYLLVFVSIQGNSISGVMVSVLASSALDYRFEPRSDQTKDNKIGIYYTPL